MKEEEIKIPDEMLEAAVQDWEPEGVSDKDIERAVKNAIRWLKDYELPYDMADSIVSGINFDSGSGLQEAFKVVMRRIFSASKHEGMKE